MAGGSKSVRDRLSQWESSLAPLDEPSREEFMKLSTTAGNRPLPQNVRSYIYQQLLLLLFLFLYSFKLIFSCHQVEISYLLGLRKMRR